MSIYGTVLTVRLPVNRFSFFEKCMTHCLPAGRNIDLGHQITLFDFGITWSKVKVSVASYSKSGSSQTLVAVRIYLHIHHGLFKTAIDFQVIACNSRSIEH